MAAQELISN